MRPSQVTEALKLAFKTRRPVMLHGSPGIGKSQCVREAAREYEPSPQGWIDLRLSQLDPVDLRGIPSAGKDSRTHWLVPAFLPKDGRGVLFHDEINHAAQATMAAAYQLVLDRRLGDYTLPDGWVIVAAGNRQSDRAIVNQMSTALRNRFWHINFEVDNDDWCQWAVTHDIHPSVLSFIRFRPTALNEFEAHRKSKEETDRVARLKDANAFATPRSWEYLSDIIKNEPPKELEHELFSGVVGEGVVAEFLGYLKNYRDLPDMDQVLMNPDKAPVPTQPATLYALATGLACKATPTNFERVVKYMSRIEQVEFQVLLIKDAILRDKSITGTRAFQGWVTKNKELIK